MLLEVERLRAELFGKDDTNPPTTPTTPDNAPDKPANDILPVSPPAPVVGNPTASTSPSTPADTNTDNETATIISNLVVVRDSIKPILEKLQDAVCPVIRTKYISMQTYNNLISLCNEASNAAAPLRQNSDNAFKNLQDKFYLTLGTDANFGRNSQNFTQLFSNHSPEYAQIISLIKSIDSLYNEIIETADKLQEAFISCNPLATIDSDNNYLCIDDGRNENPAANFDYDHSPVPVVLDGNAYQINVDTFGRAFSLISAILPNWIEDGDYHVDAGEEKNIRRVKNYPSKIFITEIHCKEKDGRISYEEIQLENQICGLPIKFNICRPGVPASQSAYLDDSDLENLRKNLNVTRIVTNGEYVAAMRACADMHDCL